MQPCVGYEVAEGGADLPMDDSKVLAVAMPGAQSPIDSASRRKHPLDPIQSPRAARDPFCRAAS